MKDVGLDVHAQNFNVAVLDQDNMFCFEEQFPTSAQRLIAVMQAIGGPKRVVLEETTIAAWVYRVLEPYAEEVVVADPCRNHWIASDDNSDDAAAARKLAKLLRGGFIHPVHHTSEDRRLFKELVLAYYDASGELVRFKNKLKAKFRRHGVHCSGDAVYDPQRRDAWLDKLEACDAALQAQMLMDSVDHFVQKKEKLRRRIRQRSRAFAEIANFRQVPGIGLIRAATFFAIVDTPHRFADKRKLWAYCGLAVVSRSSDGLQGPQHLNRPGNRLLKNIAKGAALSAISSNDNQFRRQFEALIANNVSTANAPLTVARAIVATLLQCGAKTNRTCHS